MTVKTIGIVGGGQLGRMLTLAALPLGFRVVVLDPSAHSPAAQAGAEQIVGNLYDETALRDLAARADYLTVEIEHLDANTLEAIAQAGKPVNPAPQTIRLIQDKFRQKEFLHRKGIPVAPFTDVTSSFSAKQALQRFGGSMLLKTRNGAYDGRGNRMVQSESDLQAALQQFADAPLYAEAVVPFIKELAVMVARGSDGDIRVYPVVETIHQRNICLETITPAAVQKRAATAATNLAKQVAGLLSGAGVFGIEMFLTPGGTVLVNEIAPRVHNSGHYTLDACRTSQFEQHVRAISGLPLGSTELVVPAAVMMNILGERNGPTNVQGLSDVLAIPHVGVHLYGKSPTKIDRKMGHLTATADTVAIARMRAHTARKRLDI